MPVAFSLVVHAVLLALVALGPARDLAQERRSLYAQVIAGKEKKLVWYRFRKLPEVSSGKISSSRPPETEKLHSKQTIVSKPPRAERAQQMVWRPAPQVNLKKDLTSPNLLAFRPVLVAPPPPPRVFTPPPVRRAALPAAALPAAPALAASTNTGNPALTQTRSFVPPPPKPRAVWVPAALPAAPSLAASAAAKRAPGTQENLAAALDVKPVPRTFVPPQPRAGAPGGTGNGPVIQDAPNIADNLRPDHLNVAVVGLNPAEALNGTLPNASRPAEFSAGPRPTGRTEAGGSTAGSNITIPDLTIRGGDAPPKPVLMARVSPTSLSNLTAAARSPQPASEPPPSGSMAAAAPNPLWDHREVYQIDVQMPNITSYVGSWIMWFAERQPAAGGRRELQLPKPLHKVDPKYVIGAIEERVEGKVQFAGVIRADGRVDGLRLVKSLDARLDQSAAEALLKWQFEPATLNGTPVDIDLMVEIPFRLAPRIAR